MKNLYKNLLVVFTLVLALALTACGEVPVSSNPIPQPTPVAGPKGDTGAQGPVGVAGPQGEQGIQGVAGINGTNGMNGQDASPTTLVQLCGTCVAAYPSTFPEVGLCINHKLYGVYSANGGFLVEITPGSYNSNGINCSCSFVVATDCAVN